jgi:hypothetical protein
MESEKLAKERYEKTLKNLYQNKSYEEYCEIRKSISIPGYSSAYSNEFRNYIWNKGNLFIFQLEKKRYDTFFIINEQLEIFVFFQESDGHYNVLPIKEFIDKHWERFSKEYWAPLTG